MIPAAAITRFAKDEHGTAAVLWAISLVAVLGFAALGWEIGKMVSTRAELQAYVDTLALAAAGELDGNGDAIDRANLVIANNLITDRSTFGEDAVGDGALTSADVVTTAELQSVVYLSGLPLDDTAPITATYVTTDSREAAFVQITVQPQTVVMTWLRVLNGVLGNPAGNDPRLSATAVAGFAKAACDTTPVMFCLPNNPGDELQVGDMVNLRESGGNNVQWGAGNFGFLDVTKHGDTSLCDDVEGNLLRCMLARRGTVTNCVLTRTGVDTDPGQSVGITTHAFNTRFDIYAGATSDYIDLEDFAPAPNIISGERITSGDGCAPSELAENLDITPPNDPITIPLPRDSNMYSATGEFLDTVRFGNGNWDRSGYLDTNHDLADGVADGNGSDTHLPAAPVTAGAESGSRYEMYLREIEYLTTNSNILDVSLGEKSIPQCSNLHIADSSRRVISAAGINCCPPSAETCDDDEIIIRGRTTNIPVTQYFEIFLTEPVGTSPEMTLIGEIISLPDATGDGTSGATGVFRDFVQLYR